MLYRLWHSQETELVINCVGFFFLLFLCRWDPVGFWIGYVCLLFFFAIVIRVCGWPSVWLFALIFCLIYIAIRIYPRRSALTLRFPLKGGLFYTAHGGGFPITNYHGIFVKPQKYACDFVGLNRFGTSAFGIYPRSLERYAIFGASICAPVAGKVLQSADGLPDLPPGKVDNSNVFGNHVIIEPDGDDVRIILAHMQNGSVLVKADDRVAVGQAIGKVGNSGRTFEPHLHIHAQKRVTKGSESEWVGVPIRFGSRWLVRNSLVKA